MSASRRINCRTRKSLGSVAVGGEAQGRNALRGRFFRRRSGIFAVGRLGVRDFAFHRLGGGRFDQRGRGDGGRRLGRAVGGAAVGARLACRRVGRGQRLGSGAGGLARRRLGIGGRAGGFAGGRSRGRGRGLRHLGGRRHHAVHQGDVAGD